MNIIWSTIVQTVGGLASLHAAHGLNDKEHSRP